METSDGKRHRGWDRANAHQAQIDAQPQEGRGPTRRAEKQARAAQKAKAHQENQAAASAVTVVEAQVKANPARWGRGQWQGPGMAEQLRFSGSGEAWVTVERNGERIEIPFVGPSGTYSQSPLDIVGRHPDFEVTGKTRERKVAA